MPGAEAQAGFVYQNDYAVFRLLGSEAKRVLVPAEVGDCIHSFSIEGRQTQDGEAWDVVWTLESGQISVRECKDTAITKADRGTFYRRVRKEVSTASNPNRLEIGWVTDPGKQGDILQHFEGMKKIVLREQAASSFHLPDRVTSPENALAEALYWLCSDTPDGPAMSVSLAQHLLSNLSIDRFGATELGELVEVLAAAVFESGVGSAIRNLVQGSLATTIQREGMASFTLVGFLHSIGIDRLTLQMETALRDIIEFCSSAAGSADVLGIRWECLPGRPSRVWSVAERLGESFTHETCAIMAGTGIGKTTCTVQLLGEAATRLNKHHVLRIEAWNVTPDTVSVLPRLCGLLCGVGPTWIAVDGIDQIGQDVQIVWRQTLRRLLRIPNLTIVVAARKEVVAAHDWMLELLSTMPEVQLAELPDRLIRAEFERVGLSLPENRSLVECLRNPFLFSLYARIASADDIPLSNGNVTGFDVIGAYWERRVSPTSQGFRAVGDPAMSGHAKRSAASYLAEQTILGAISIQRGSDLNIGAGIEMLCREGIIVSHSTTTVVWCHSWLREFAVTQCLIGKLAEITSQALADAVAAIAIDHSSRIAAVGACKWLCSHRDVGSVEGYLTRLHERKAGLGREALAVLLEDSPRHLNLAQLSPALLLEALVFVRQMRAEQWLNQVAELPDAIFVGELGEQLQLAALEYEREVGEL